MIALRPYQSAIVDAVRASYRTAHRAPLVVLATGAGKTVIFSAIAEGAASKGSRVLIMAHRVELVDQICAALRQFDVEPDIIAADFDRRDSHVSVASVQTLVRRLDEPLPDYNLIICDEAHHVATSEGVHRGANSWGKIFKRWPNAKHLGVTATPMRLDGRGLGEFFDDLIVGPDVAELREAGFLAPLRVFAPASIDMSGVRTQRGDYVASDVESALVASSALVGDVLGEYKKRAEGKRALVFTVSVRYAEAIAAKFRDAGYSAAYLHGGTLASIRRSAVRDFQDGRLQVMASCDLFSEGFDCPGAEVGVMLRPTKSLAMYRQQVGRILRPAPDKTALLLDHVGNVARHGMPDDPVQWTLSTDQDVKKKDTPSPRICPKCFCAFGAWLMVCPECRYSFESKPREIDHINGELGEIDPFHWKAKRREVQATASTLADLQRIERERGYRRGWANHVWAGRTAKRG